MVLKLISETCINAIFPSHLETHNACSGDALFHCAALMQRRGPQLYLQFCHKCLKSTKHHLDKSESFWKQAMRTGEVKIELFGQKKSSIY